MKACFSEAEFLLCILLYLLPQSCFIAGEVCAFGGLMPKKVQLIKVNPKTLRLRNDREINRHTKVDLQGSPYRLLLT
jgi:hypothetical protein